ncbi:MAG: cyclic nucleotide-gated ion channel [Methyloceanibacter sp.]|uniref:cyclic nucleotide-gated ion channel n=1 Tax=Methyloceanibacter sp. TaxID=1965321 RepID=UPI003D9B7B32
MSGAEPAAQPKPPNKTWAKWRRKVHDVLEFGGDARPAGYLVNAFIITLIVLNAAAFAAETVDDIAIRYGRALDAFNAASVLVFTVEYVLRIWSSIEIPMLSRLPKWRARLRFAARPMMIIDLLAVLPWYLYLIFPVDLRLLRVFRIFRLLKLVRYSPALQTLGRVIADEYRALLGALLVMVVLLLFSSSVIYFLERDAQPNVFGSIPAAAWWSLATLTTVGYGDVVPLTPMGRVFGGVVMLLGVCMFALPIAIIATGFSLESARHQFVATWSMVARVPLFSSMNEGEVAEITKVLYTRTYLPGSPIVRAGDAGDAMYIIANGEAELLKVPGGPVMLREGDFFGEMALLERRRHRHDVFAKTQCRVFVLDSQALARLSRRHPEVMRAICTVARNRSRMDAQAKNVSTPRKRRAVPLARRKPGAG